MLASIYVARDANSALNILALAKNMNSALLPFQKVNTPTRPYHAFKHRRIVICTAHS